MRYVTISKVQYMHDLIFTIVKICIFFVSRLLRGNIPKYCSSKWSHYFVFIRKESLEYGARNWSFKGKLKWSITALMLNGAPTSVISRCGWQMLLLCRMCIRWLFQPPTGTYIFMTCQHQFTHHNFIFVVSVVFVIIRTYSFFVDVGDWGLRLLVWDFIMENIGGLNVQACLFCVVRVVWMQKTM